MTGAPPADGAHAYLAVLPAVPARLLTYLGFTLAIGAGVWRVWLLPRARAAADAAPAAFARASAAVALVGSLGATAGLVGAGWQFAVQLGSLADMADSRAERAALVLRTFWGRGWAAQFAAFGVAAVAFTLARRHEQRRHRASPGGTPDAVHAVPAARWAWRIGTAAALAGAALQATLGHAAADAGAPVLALVSGGAHAVAAALWLGALAVLALVWRVLAEPGSMTGAGRLAPGALVAPQIMAFSPLALGAASVTALAGVVNAWLRLAGAGDPPSAAARLAALPSTGYGRLLLAKGGVVLVVAAVGAVNFRRRATAGDVAALDRRTRGELAAALLAFALTAALSLTSPPGNE